jgi:molecular chaperone HtpG
MDKTAEIKIGKNTLESLTTSMYDDARFIFREYVQNSADAIDKAKTSGLLQDGNIYITIEPDKKRITIEDDATGIEKSKISEYLRNVGMSAKEKGVDKGFRGIGRLGGLGYCQTLIFETSVKGENEKSIVKWNADKLRQIIADTTKKEQASEVIDEVTIIEYKAEQSEKHYFKVILKNVTSEKLLNVKDVRQYLSMVAPVPFKKSIFSDKIYAELKNENIKLDEYPIFVNQDQIFKGYKWYVYEGDENNPQKVDEVIGIEFFKETFNEKILYWGWYGLTEKNQLLKPVNFARGFRLRSKNIQIGDETTLKELHKDSRFQNYMFGEIHAINQALTPNARRDNFVKDMVEYEEFSTKIKMFFATTIYNLCYDASKVNSAVKDITAYSTLKTKFDEKQKQGWTDKTEREEWFNILEMKKEKAETANKTIEKLQAKTTATNQPVVQIIQKATEKIKQIKPLDTDAIEVEEKPKFRTDKLSKLDKKERKFLGEIFSIINTVLTNDLAENLIQKIEEKYK